MDYELSVLTKRLGVCVKTGGTLSEREWFQKKIEQRIRHLKGQGLCAYCYENNAQFNERCWECHVAQQNYLKQKKQYEK